MRFGVCLRFALASALSGALLGCNSDPGSGREGGYEDDLGGLPDLGPAVDTGALQDAGVLVDSPPVTIDAALDGTVLPDGGSAGAIPVRNCRTVFSYTLGRPARSVSVAGEWNSFSATANPLTDANNSGVFRAELDLPPGDYGYKIVVDGTQWLLDPGAIALKYVGGVENSRVVVRDCNIPELRVLAHHSPPEGALSLDVQYVEGGDRAGVDPASVRVTMAPGVLPPSGVNFDPRTGRVTVRVSGLARTKYTLRVDARSRSGRAATQLIVPLWVEASPYQWGDGPLYFVFTDRFRNGDRTNDGRSGTAAIADWNGGDFAGVIAALREGYFDQMGVRALWLSPVNSNTDSLGRGSDGRNYSGYHGYWVNRARETDRHWGTLAALRELNAEAHRHGIRVLYDLVNNQLHRDHPYYRDHMRDGWFNGDGTCTCGSAQCPWDDRPLDCWFTNYLPDVNWAHMPVVDQMIDDAWWWLTETDADGFRVDAVKHMNFTATANLRARLDAYETGNARVYTVGETFTGGDEGGRQLIRRYVGRGALHAQFDFPMYWAIRRAFAQNAGTMGELEGAVQASERVFGDAPMSPFLGNHDVERFMSEAAGQLRGDTRELGYNNPPPPPDSDEPYERMAAAFTFTLTQRGVPLVYYGDEIGLPGAADPDNRRAMRFGGDLNARERRLLAHVQAVGRLRATHEGLRRGARRSLHTDGDGYVYARGTGADIALVAINRGSTARTVRVTLPAELGASDGTMLRDALGGAAVRVMGGAVEVAFRARSSAVYVR